MNKTPNTNILTVVINGTTHTHTQAAPFNTQTLKSQLSCAHIWNYYYRGIILLSRNTVSISRSTHDQ